MEIQERVELKDKNSFALPAIARFYVELSDARQLPEILAWAEQRSLPFMVLGGGSNVVFSRDFDGLVIKMNLKGIDISESFDFAIVNVAAGESWPQLVEYTLEHGLYGLENLSLIPGSVGAAPIQNIGAYGVELESVFHSLIGWDCQQKCWRNLSRTECQFAYRDSIFKGELKDRFIITEVVLSLSKIPLVDASYAALANQLSQQGIEDPTPRQLADAVIAVRRSKLPDPAKLPNAGSFFKNPLVGHEQLEKLLSEYPELVHYPHTVQQEKLAAGWLIETAGWKGRRDGDVASHKQQSLVLVNYGNATGAELLAFARQIQADINTRFAVQLAIEPRVY
jgi:UDP-N-acetylmuramate dehydrogenase